MRGLTERRAQHDADDREQTVEREGLAGSRRIAAVTPAPSRWLTTAIRSRE